MLKVPATKLANHSCCCPPHTRFTCLMDSCYVPARNNPSHSYFLKHRRTKNWFNNFSQQFDQRLLQSAKTSAENKRRLLQHMPRAAQPCLADIRFCKALAKCTPDIEKGCERLQDRAKDQHGGVSAAVAVNSCGGWQTATRPGVLISGRPCLDCPRGRPFTLAGNFTQ